MPVRASAAEAYRAHALRGNAAGDALRLAALERRRMRSHAERGNDRDSAWEQRTKQEQY
jgi:hypothetical protein